MKKVLLIAAAFIGSYAAQAQTTWTNDKAHGALGFTISHLGGLSTLPGEFKSFDVKVTTNKEDLSDAKVEMTADVNSINTGNEARDKHLASPDFFGAEKNPTITFVSKSFQKVKGNQYKVVGNLTMNGITKEVTLTAVYNGKKEHPMNKKPVSGFTVTGQIKRSDFNIGKDMGEAIISDVVQLNASFELVQG